MIPHAVPPPPHAPFPLPRQDERPPPYPGAVAISSRFHTTAAADTTSNDSRQMHDSHSDERILEEMNSGNVETASVTDLKAYSCRLLRSYRTMKTLASAEEEEQKAVKEEIQHWEKWKAWHMTSAAGSAVENSSSAMRNVQSQLERLQKRSWWLQQRQFRRQQLRARIQQVVVALEAAKQSEDEGGAGVVDEHSFQFASRPVTPMDLSWM